MTRQWILLVLALTLFGCQRAAPQRYGMVIGLKADQVEEYTKLHAGAWPEVLSQIDRSHMRNFSIWLVEVEPGRHLLFAYFEYDGDDFEADMAAMGDHAPTKKWWKLTDPMQEPIPTAGPEEHWVMMREVFYHDRETPDVLMPPPSRQNVGKAE